MYEKLLSMMYALKFGVADLHYWIKGSSFYGNHKFADYIRYGEDEDDHILSKYIDDINEVCFLGAERETPYSKDIVSAALEFIPVKTTDEEQLFRNIKELIYSILVLIEKLVDDASAGEANLLGNIAQDLQQRYGLLWRRVR